MNRKLLTIAILVCLGLLFLALLPLLTGIHPRFAIFPERGLSKSLYVPVLMGLILMTVFTESLGWNYSGLVVPGYLTPLILIKPWSAGMIIAEALLTYLIVRGLARLPAAFGYWSAFFGRDRFFLILVVSIGIRIFLESWAIDRMIPFFEASLSLTPDFRGNLYSIGLIIVPLLGNMFWNSGLRRGLFPVAFSIFATYLIVNYIVVVYTNYSVSNIEILYEDLALEFVFSSKAYLIMIVAAFLASRANLMYGWDFSGILIPSLLALAWLTPLKILMTIVESSLILILARFITQRKFMMTVTLEGPRKIMLLFSIGFLLKWIIGFYTSAAFPAFKASDLFGFGFLLPSLIAAKMWQKSSFSKILGPIIRVSVVSVILGNLLGFALFLTNKDQIRNLISPRIDAYEAKLVLPERDLLREIVLNKAFVKRAGESNPPARPKASEHRLLKKVFTEMVGGPAGQRSGNGERIRQKYQARLLEIDVDITLFEQAGKDRHLLIQNRTDQIDRLAGWGSVVCNLESNTRLVIEAPYPISEPGSLEAAAGLFLELDGALLIIAGSDSEGGNLPSADVLVNRSLPFTHWHELALGMGMDILRIRSARNPNKGEPVLEIAKTPADDLNPKKLEALLGPIQWQWNSTREFSMPSPGPAGSFQELTLTSDSIHRLSSALWKTDVPSYEGNERIDAFFESRWAAGDFLPAASDRLWRIRKPDVREKVLFSQDLIPELWRQAEKDPKSLTPEALSDLAGRAEWLGFSLMLYRSPERDETFLILYEKEKSSRLWGTFLFRAGKTLPIVVETPRPLKEFDTLAMGFWLFDHLTARAMIWPGAKTRPNTSPLTDALSEEAMDMPFNLAHQAFSRVTQPERKRLGVIQVRGFSEQDHPEQTRAVVNIGREVTSADQLSGFQRQLVYMLRQYGMGFDYFNGSPEMIDFGVYGNIQSTFSGACCEEEFITFWFPRSIRRALTRFADDEQMAQLCRRQSLPTLQGSLSTWLSAHVPEGDPESPETIPYDLNATAENLLQYKAYRNENYIAQTIGNWKQTGWSASCFTDTQYGNTFLLFQGPHAAVGLNPVSYSARLTAVDLNDKEARSSIRDFRRGKDAILTVTKQGVRSEAQAD